MDETWIHHFTSDTKKQLKECTKRVKSTPKKAQTVPSADKVMVSVFWDVQSVPQEKVRVYSDSFEENFLFSFLAQQCA